MKIEQIETFLMITETKKLSLASKNLFISQSAVSHRLRALEEHLDCELFIRGRGEKLVTLTQKGEKFIEIAMRWKALWRETKIWALQESKMNLSVASLDSLNTCVFSNLYKELINNNNTDDKLYLSPILDCFNNEIISYQLSKRPVYDLVKQMLDCALKGISSKRKHKEELTLHSDQGWHYQMKPFATTLKANNIKQSMSRKGNCLDNALMQSFFGTLKCETIYIEKPNSIEALEKQIHEYITYYNHERIQLKLKGLSPVQYRTQSLG